MTDNRFDNFPLVADKIRVKSTDKGLLCSQMMKPGNDACKVFCETLESNKS